MKLVEHKLYVYTLYIHLNIVLISINPKQEEGWNYSEPEQIAVDHEDVGDAF